MNCDAQPAPHAATNIVAVTENGARRNRSIRIILSCDEHLAMVRATYDSTYYTVQVRSIA